ncbi:MAG: M23 family metallopeptidase [Chlorobium sp.]|jgi:murein DD-endopeptidase MepM/ murein hydrolase activator NlpD|nr:M23 family metallopeptidase [Chlorobium sp.]
MFSKNRFFLLSEHGRNLKKAGKSAFFAGLVFICSSFPSSPLISSAIAEEKPSASAEGLLASTEEMIEHLILQIDRQSDNSPEIKENYQESGKNFFSSIPNIKPVPGAITSHFGQRFHPVYNTMLFHAGVDFSAAIGTRVQATGSGVITFSGYDKGYGEKVVINHGYGFETVYAHLSKSLVRQGQRVNRGEIIALTGNSGVSTGPHLHYEVRKHNVKVNPTAYFFNGGNPSKFITNETISAEANGSNS